MALERTTIQGHEGDIYCRPTTWLDIAKFMLLNYVLHALTVIPEPGGGFILALFSSVTAVIFPLFGTDKAIARIAGARRSKDPLERAKRAGALCMVVPRDSGLGHPVVPAIISVHGSYPPVSADQFSTSIDLPVLAGVKEKKGPQPPAPYELVTVPSYFVTRPIPPQHVNEPQRVMELAYNTAVLKSLAALVQICYGSYELYVASGNQISRLGYAAYSLTIIPYVLMSALNLIGTLCCPSYPSLYIVYYRGTDGYQPPVPDCACPAPGGSGGGSTGRHNGDAESVQVIRPLTADQRERKAAEVSPREEWMEAVESRIVGAVGRAYALSPSSRKQYEREHKHTHLIQTVLTSIAGTLLFVLPYILTYILTGYRPNQSTLAERIIIVSSLTVSQVLYITIAFMHHSSPRLDEPEYKYGWYPCSVYGHWPSGSYGPAQISAWLNMDNGKRLLVAMGVTIAVAPSVAGFVMVGRMILGDEVCVKL